MSAMIMNLLLLGAMGIGAVISVGSALRARSSRDRTVPAGLQAELENRLKSIFAGALGVSEADVGLDRSYLDMGGDSLTAQEIRARVEQLVGVRLSPAVLWDDPTVSSLAEYLAVQHATDILAMSAASSSGLQSNETVMTAKFEISKDKTGKFRFYLKAGNGEIIAAGQGYESEAAAEKGIESIKTNAPGAAVVDLTA
jgi:uncharacterized protein YegP (UPF0339 family)/acyl carrier protein